MINIFKWISGNIKWDFIERVRRGLIIVGIFRDRISIV